MSSLLMLLIIIFKKRKFVVYDKTYLIFPYFYSRTFEKCVGKSLYGMYINTGSVFYVKLQSDFH